MKPVSTDLKKLKISALKYLPLKKNKGKKYNQKVV